MTEIQEVAQAIYDQRKELWPLTRRQAGFVAEQLAGDQGHQATSLLIDALMELNPPFRDDPAPPSEPVVEYVDPKEQGLLYRLELAENALESLKAGGLDVGLEQNAAREARLLLNLILLEVDGVDLTARTAHEIVAVLRGARIKVRDFNDETGMTPEQLAEKYAAPDGSWGTHPRFTRRQWHNEVLNENTQRGYWDWVVAQIEQEAND